ncbi:hypothetical protein DICVIV_07400 [Dictyocaulus viviparus]|uniref:CHY zinc finger n=1 Tax=Dictyocaulus viviparus TaxID=29172 RepID=A0A0D8XRV7_DICVI|nr:hypothetical protein DICVIV_07400 [Dictyocaulus viviparus]
MNDAGNCMPTVDAKQRKRTHPNRVCRYFKTAQGCRKGDACNFMHQKECGVEEMILDGYDTQNEERFNSAVAPKPSVSCNQEVFVPPNVRPGRFQPAKIVLNSDQTGTEGQIAAKELDVKFFRRRFPKCVETTCEKFTIITFNYRVTDPDWVFIVRSVLFRITLKPEHPIEPPVIETPQSGNDDLPITLVTYLERCINEFIENSYTSFRANDAFELVGKAERNGISLVMPSHHVNTEKFEKAIDPKFRENEVGDKQECDGKLQEEEVAISLIKELDVCEDNCGASDIKKSNSEFPNAVLDVPLIEVALIWRELSGNHLNIATIAAVHLFISSKCLRCSHEHGNKICVDNRPYRWQCNRCCITQSMRLQPQLVHEHSTTVALLEARGCRPLDCILRDSLLKFVCLTCQKEEEVQQLNYGTLHKSWCHNCHSLCQFTINAIRFRGDFSRIPNQDLATASKITRTKKKASDMFHIRCEVPFVEGQALPEFGTCKHYRKSYRWLRFPCCGKAFPCDICHEESTCGEHEMKIANRMICGHCSKEQPYTAGKPCSNCSRSLTRNRSHFWEGGKGCRDQLMMSRKDNHKFVHNQQGTAKKNAHTKSKK